MFLPVWVRVIALSSVIAAPEMSQEIADDSSPPELGDVVFQHSLTGPGVLNVVRCPTGRNVGEFVGDGYIMKVTGRCTAGATNTFVVQPIRALTFPDGEFRLDVYPVTGVERLRLRLGVRVQPDPSNAIGYAIRLEPGQGRAEIIRQRGEQDTAALAQRGDLQSRFADSDWTTVAVRAQGSSLWLLINEEPVLSANDSTFADGAAVLITIRQGSLDDDQETAVVFRNLRISTLKGSDPARSPVFKDL